MVPPALKPVRPLAVIGLFKPDRDALLALLNELAPSQWSTSTVCSGWDVRDVALHMLGGDLASISGHRDGAWGLQPRAEESLGVFINRINHEWVAAARRLSPRLIVELLQVTGPTLFAYLQTVDPLTPGGVVSWAGLEPAPYWLDLAREYMERWVHQQHIRDAVGNPGQFEPKFVAPVVAASMNALPVALAHVRPRMPNAVVVRVDGEGGGCWSIIREGHRWQVYEGAAADALTEIVVSVEDWWRLVTLGLSAAEAHRRSRVSGDAALAEAVFATVAIIA
ncbi:MAG TPA: maleylpyruvate isomerase family mycothiol-dependent enzyme [Candidatus Dormibacteraeota bacterium]|nr:maleylpyruvate isomerase family mycothiol-dependent enzyme [Candidatus Dormibacteraeota bacterium]